MWHGGPVGMNVCCPRCGGPVRPPDLMHTDWRCDRCGPTPPLHLPHRIGPDVMAAVVAELCRDPEPMPLWSLWPLPAGWTVTGAGWVGDERSVARAAVLAASGPAPLTGGPADLLLISEVPATGLATRFAGLPGPDPGPLLTDAMAEHSAHAKPRAGRHPVPLWSVPSSPQCSAYVGEARGVWLVGVAWPATAGYLFADELVLHDLVDWLPPELVYGAPSTRLVVGETGNTPA